MSGFYASRFTGHHVFLEENNKYYKNDINPSFLLFTSSTHIEDIEKKI